MQLPNCVSAFIEPQKLTRYLLSETHTVGKAKAKFFRALGFNETNVVLLENELLRIAKEVPFDEVMNTVHGPKYVITGEIVTPLGKSITILTVWIINTGEIAPRFVTARPYKDKPT